MGYDGSLPCNRNHPVAIDQLETQYVSIRVAYPLMNVFTASNIFQYHNCANDEYEYRVLAWSALTRTHDPCECVVCQCLLVYQDSRNELD